MDPGRPRGSGRPVPRRDGAQTPHRDRRLPWPRVPARERPQHHQHRAGGGGDALPPHDQRLPRVLARLRLLLRPPDPRVPRPRHRRGLRHQDRGQGERGRAAPGRAPVLEVGRRAHRHGHQHRPVPGRRRQVPPDPGHHRRPERGPQPVQHSDQVDPGAARPRGPGRRRRPHRRPPQPLDRHPRPGRLAADRAGNATAGQAGGRGAPAQRGRDPLRRPGGPGAARALRPRRPGPSGRRGLPGRRGHLDRRRAAAPATRDPRPLHGLAGPEPARPGPPLRRALRRPLLPGQGRAGPAGRPRGRDHQGLGGDRRRTAGPTGGRGSPRPGIRTPRPVGTTTRWPTTGADDGCRASGVADGPPPDRAPTGDRPNSSGSSERGW